MTHMTKDYLRMLAGLPTGTNATGSRDFVSVMEAKKLPEEMTDEQFDKHLKKCNITGDDAVIATKKRKAAMRKMAKAAITEEAADHQYDTSTEFTEEFDDAAKKVQDLKAFIDSPRLAHWLKETDSNYDADALSKLPALKSAIAEIEKLMSELDDHLTDLS